MNMNICVVKLCPVTVWLCLALNVDRVVFSCHNKLLMLSFFLKEHEYTVVATWRGIQQPNFILRKWLSHNLRNPETHTKHIQGSSGYFPTTMFLKCYLFILYLLRKVPLRNETSSSRESWTRQQYKQCHINKKISR